MDIAIFMWFDASRITQLDCTKIHCNTDMLQKSPQILEDSRWCHSAVARFCKSRYMAPGPVIDRCGASEGLGYSAVTPRSACFGVWYVVNVEIRRVPISIALPRRVSSGLMWAKKAPNRHTRIESNDMARPSGLIFVCGSGGPWSSRCAS